jgi:D-alanine-D-alanine ligase
MQDRRQRIAVLMGGRSAERDISLVTGRECAKALRMAGYSDVVEIDIAAELFRSLAEVKPDVCFNALHGPLGEDGSIQGFLNVLGIPYTHSGVTASSLAMHKEHAKRVARLVGIRCPLGTRLTFETFFKQEFDRPYVVKPINDGSSVHTYIVRDPKVLPFAPGDWPYRDAPLVENLIEGIELTVTVLNGAALTVTEIVPRSSFYDYESKYAEGGSRHILPARLPAPVFQLCKEWAEAMHSALECRGISRSDFIFDESRGPQGLFFLEINTQPGMTPTSLAPEQAGHCGISFPELVSRLVACAATD